MGEKRRKRKGEKKRRKRYMKGWREGEIISLYLDIHLSDLLLGD